MLYTLVLKAHKPVSKQSSFFTISLMYDFNMIESKREIPHEAAIATTHIQININISTISILLRIAKFKYYLILKAHGSMHSITYLIVRVFR